MRYAAVVTREEGATLAEFPDCPGCQTFAKGADIAPVAREALEGWLESSLTDRRAPVPRPSAKARAPRGGRVLWVDVSPRLALQLSLRWAREDAGLTQAQLAERVGVSQQQIAKLEHPDSNPTIETLERVARALGARLDVGLTSLAP